MKWKNIILMNWGILESGVYDFGDMNVLKGETGIGKTTLQDAIQLIMSANLRGVARYNAAQEDATERKGGRNFRRTPEEYALGAEEGAYARPQGSVSYVALSFVASEIDKRRLKPFTAIAALQASLNVASARRRAAHLDHLAFALIEGDGVTVDTFLAPDNERALVSMEKLHHHLKQNFPGQLHYFNADQGGKHEYLTRLHAMICDVDMMSQHEALEASRSWAKTIAYRKLEDVNDLVRNEVLEDKPVAKQLEDVSRALTHLSDVTEEARRLEVNKNTLEQVVVQGESTVRNMVEFLSVQYADPLRSTEQIVREERRLRSKKETLEVNQAELVEDAKKLTQELLGLNKELTALNLARSQIPGAAEKDSHAQAIGHAKRQFAGARKLAMDALRAFSDRAAIASEIQVFRPGSIPLRQAGDAVTEALRSLTRTDPAVLLAQLEKEAFDESPDAAELARLKRDIEALEQNQAQLVEAILGANGYQSVALQVAGQHRHDVDRLEREVNDIRRRRADIEKGGSDYPVRVALMLDVLNRELPLSCPKVLCDLIDPIPGSPWMNAIEGYIGNARFNLLVERSYELDATRKLRDHRAGPTVRIIQTERVLEQAKRLRADPRSIVTELDIKHPLAETYMQVTFGNALKLDDEEEVKTAARGVTRTGLCTSNNTQYECYLLTEQLVFGADAKRQASVRLREEESQKNGESMQKHAEVAWIERLQARLHKVVSATMNSSEHVVAMLAALADERTATDSLAALDLTALDEIESKIKTKEGEIEAASKEQNENKTAQISTGADLRSVNDDLTKLAERSDREQARLDTARQLLRFACDQDSGLVLEELINRAQEEAERAAEATQAQNRLSGAIGNYIQARSRFEAELRTYNQAVVGRSSELIAYTSLVVDGRDHESVVRSYGAVAQTLNTVRAMLKRYREIEIEANRAKLEEARSAFNSTLVASLCLTVKGHVDEGLEQINRLNERLSGVRFGEDWFEVVPEPAKNYWHYYEFFNAVGHLGDALEKEDLFSTRRLDDHHRQTLDQLGRLLQSKNAADAQKELGLLSDYRNYRTYDVRRHTGTKQSILISEWGKRGSGGQLETAGYVLRFTVLSNKLKHFDKNRRAHLRAVILDEAFQNMDEERTRAMIRFVRDELHLQLILAVPLTKVNQFLDEFDREFAFSRITSANGELDYVTRMDVKTLNREEFGMAWDERRAEVVKRALTGLENEAA